MVPFGVTEDKPGVRPSADDRGVCFDVLDDAEGLWLHETFSDKEDTLFRDLGGTYSLARIPTQLLVPFPAMEAQLRQFFNIPVINRVTPRRTPFNLTPARRFRDNAESASKKGKYKHYSISDDFNLEDNLASDTNSEREDSKTIYDRDQRPH
jgi:hypothetical protein